jgi:hypothetical protein
MFAYHQRYAWMCLLFLVETLEEVFRHSFDFLFSYDYLWKNQSLVLVWIFKIEVVHCT